MSRSARRTWAVVPVKPLSEAKSRLKPVLSNKGRAELAGRLLKRTLAVLAEVPAIDRVLVISRDPRVLSLARQTGALTLAEPAVRGLNLAVRHAREAAIANGANRLLVIASDLPFLSTEDVGALFGALATSDTVLAPDRHGAGTNALLLRPPDAISPAFGSGSFEKHFRQARLAGIHPVVVRIPGLGFDLDLPSDYADLLRLAPEWGVDEVTVGVAT